MGFNWQKSLQQPSEEVKKISPNFLEAGNGKHLPILPLAPDVQRYIEKMCEVFQVDIDFCVSAVFSAVTAAVGNKVEVVDRKGYKNTLALWLCQVAPSGYGKTPVEDAVMKPFLEMQELLRHDYLKKRKEWLKEKEGEPPKQRRVFVSDSTPEALYQALEDNDDGLLLFREELSGWVEDFGRYNCSGETNTLLSIWSGKSIDTNRLGREGNFIKSPCLNVFGGTQPDRLAKVFGKDVLLASGFDARILWVYPETQISIPYNDCKLEEDLLIWWNDFVSKFFDIEQQKLTFSDEAHRIYVDYWESVQEKKIEASSFMQEVLSKLQIYAEKFAGLYYLLSEANCQAEWKQTEIDGESMKAAVEAMGLFEEWAQKVYERICVTSTGQRPTKAQVVRLFSEYYPVKNIQMFADSLGVSRQLISRALNSKAD